jgi:hypothetical protein
MFLPSAVIAPLAHGHHFWMEMDHDEDNKKQHCNNSGQSTKQLNSTRQSTARYGTKATTATMEQQQRQRPIMAGISTINHERARCGMESWRLMELHDHWSTAPATAMATATESGSKAMIDKTMEQQNNLKSTKR